MATYATAEDVRSALDVDSEVLSDVAAERLLGFAEDRIDDVLMGRDVEDDGRKVDITDTDLEAYQLTKLALATARLAARFYEEPELVHDQRFSSQSGEISASGPLSEVLGPAVMGPLRASGLMVRPATSVKQRRLDDRGVRSRTPERRFSIG